MKHSWLTIAFLLGILTSFITFFLTSSWKLSMLAGMLITIAVMINNPVRRFIKAFWIVVSMMIVLNKYFIEFVGDFSGIQFKFYSLAMVNTVTILLLFLSMFCLFFDYKEKSGKEISFFVLTARNKITNFSKNNDQKLRNISSERNEEDIIR